MKYGMFTLFVIYMLSGCSVGSLDMASNRQVVIEPRRIEINGDINSIVDYYEVKKIMRLMHTYDVNNSLYNRDCCKTN